MSVFMYLIGFVPRAESEMQYEKSPMTPERISESEIFKTIFVRSAERTDARSGEKNQFENLGLIERVRQRDINCKTAVTAPEMIEPIANADIPSFGNPTHQVKKS